MFIIHCRVAPNTKTHSLGSASLGRVPDARRRLCVLAGLVANDPRVDEVERAAHASRPHELV